MADIQTNVRKKYYHAAEWGKITTKRFMPHRIAIVDPVAWVSVCHAGDCWPNGAAMWSLLHYCSFLLSRATEGLHLQLHFQHCAVSFYFPFSSLNMHSYSQQIICCTSYGVILGLIW